MKYCAQHMLEPCWVHARNKVDNPILDAPTCTEGFHHVHDPDCHLFSTSNKRYSRHFRHRSREGRRWNVQRQQSKNPFASGGIHLAISSPTTPVNAWACERTARFSPCQLPIPLACGATPAT